MSDVAEIQKVYDSARQFMYSHGNKTQWGENYPGEDLIIHDIENGDLYAYETDGKIHGVFAFFIGQDPTYQRIEQGSWLSDTLYGTIHRVASDGAKNGIMQKTVSYCENKIPHIRIDTHEDNKIMQNLIQENGFRQCGIIYTEDGSPRIAYEKI
ncbi:N-acetyltransferase [Blautia liquoris]|nr:N-acetyltransferase [Blautia liquoris]